jgi:hypothetical protein
MNLFDEFFWIVRELGKHNIAYSVVGGIAMAFHAEPRFTRDIDLLVARKEMRKVKRLLQRLGYFESSKPWRFENTRLTLHRFMKTEGEDHLVADILTGEEPRYREIIENSIEAEWADGFVRVARKEDIIWMKQQRGSDQDRVDIKRLKDDKDRKNG